MSCFLSVGVVKRGHSRSWRLAIWALAITLVASGINAATFTATLDRDTVTLGESAMLSLSFTGGSPSKVPSIEGIPNLVVAAGQSSQHLTMVNGQFSSTVTYSFALTARQPGDYTIPSLTAQVAGQTLKTPPLTLKVVTPSAPTAEALRSGTQDVFLKLMVPKKEFFVGETVAAELQLYLSGRVQNVGQFQLTGFPSDGFNLGNMAQGQRRQAQVGSARYTVIPLLFPLKAVKAGAFALGPATATVVVELPPRGRGRGSLFSFFDNEQSQLSLATEGSPVQIHALPGDNVPPAFNGAVGNFTLSLTAGPTNVAAGDPITVRIRLSGRGSLDSLTLPEQAGWRDFKTYPPTAKVESNDPLGLQGTKTFEQIVSPQHADIKALPAVSFAFFDPDHKAYRTLSHPPVPLVVRPGGSPPVPTVLAAPRQGEEKPPPAQDIVPNKQRLGKLVFAGAPLVQQSWFVALQGVPVLALFTALWIRWRTDNLANNPRLRRQRQVARLVAQGIRELRQLASRNQSDEFFATLFRLLQEQLGERLDLPASAITEAVIEERLRPRGVPDTLLLPLQELFQSCNLARYAPVRTSQELAALVPKLESLLKDLQHIKT